MARNKILLIGPAWVGDMVMAQSLFKLLKQQDSDVILDVMAPAWSQALLERMPEIRKAIVMPLGHGDFSLRKRWQLGCELREEKYTQAIVLPNSWKSALIPFAAHISRRTAWLGEMRWGLLNDIRFLDKELLPLMVQRFMALGLSKSENKKVLDTDFIKKFRPALQVDSQSVANTLLKFNLPIDSQQPILALCPGAEFGPAKRWPSEHYAEVARAKLSEGYQVWLFGSPKDQIVATEIQSLIGHAAHDFTGKTTLGEAVDLLSLANLVVSNDSGLMHIAASLQRPLVVVYGSSSPKFTPPLSDQVKMISLNLPCSPCFKRECPLTHLNCLNQLSPDLVLKAAAELK